LLSQKNKPLYFKGDNAPPSLTQNVLRAQRPFHIAAIIASRQLGLDDIQFAVLDEKVSGGNENSDANPRYKSSQFDDPSDYQDKDIIGSAKAITCPNQPFVHKTEREQD